MAGDLLEVDSPEALAQALPTLQAGLFLAYRPAGGEQISLFIVKNQTAYYCDLHRRSPLATTKEAVKSIGFKLQDINEAQRLEDSKRGLVPTIASLTLEEAKDNLLEAVALPMASPDAVPVGTRFSRMVNTLFGKKTPSAAELHHGEKASHVKQQK